MSDDVSFLWSRLVDLKFVKQEAEYVLQKEEFRPIELHVRQHVAHQGVPAIWSALGQERLKYHCIPRRTSGHPVAIGEKSKGSTLGRYETTWAYRMSVCLAKTLTRGTCRYARRSRGITQTFLTVLTSTNEIDFTRLWQRRQRLSAIKASHSG